MVRASFRIWLRGLLLTTCLGLCFPVSSQTTYYVYPGGSDANAGTPEAPFRTVYKALEVATTGDSVRLAVGEYLVSAPKTGGRGELVIPAGVMVQGGFGVRSDGVVLKVQVYSGEGKDIRTTLKGDSTCRIARVAGVLENVTVAGGLASQQNGGGMYVESGGVVRNCIIHSNTATGLVPKVGDLLMRDGSFVVASNFQADQIEELEGVIFWINPIKDAPVGQRGKVVATRSIDTEYWIVRKSGNLGSSFSSAERMDASNELAPIKVGTLEEALLDVDGEVYTDFLIGLGTSSTAKFRYPAAEACRAYRDGLYWYMPAPGELMLMLVEWGTVWRALNAVWDVLAPAERKIYFGVAASGEEEKEWKMAGSVAWHSQMFSSSAYVPSTASSVTAYPGNWRLNTFWYGAKLEPATSVRSVGGSPFLLVQALPVRKF